jgi:hypothetical protein
MKKSDRDFQEKKKAELREIIDQAANPRVAVHECYKTTIKAMMKMAIVDFLIHLREDPEWSPNHLDEWVDQYIEERCIPID